MRPTVYVTPSIVREASSSSPLEQHVDARIDAARRAMEARAQAIPPREAAKLRARFDAKLAQIDAAVARAAARGEVTATDAAAVRAATVRQRRASMAA